MAGVPVQSTETSENFLLDVRKTIAELVVDQFYGTLADLAKQKGVSFTAESVAPTMMSDGLAHYKKVDVPMGEFWLNSPTHDKPNDMMDAISGAHIYGKKIIQAEAFTTVRMDWNEHPGNMKTVQDRNYALGINKLVYHVFAHNPWVDRKPGMTLDGVGLYFQRDQTWWKPGKAWVDYALHSQELLQTGLPVVDLAVFVGEDLPSRSVLPDRLVAVLPGLFGKDVVKEEQIRLANLGTPLRQIPAGVTHSANMADPENWVNPLRGYAYDSFNPDVLSTATVKDGRTVFSSGANYKVLIIPGNTSLNPNYKWMSATVLSKLVDLTKQGATILIGDQPQYQTGMINTINKGQFDFLINELWSGDFKKIKVSSEEINVKTLGKGMVIKGPFQAQNLDYFNLQQDLIVKESTQQYAKKIAYTHRVDGDQEIYFLANQEGKERVLDFSFRVEGKVPELYDPITLKTIGAQEWSNQDHRTNLKLKLAANASTFVIFKKPTTQTALNEGKNWKEYAVLERISGTWTVKFDEAFGGPAKPAIFEELSSWTKNRDSLIKYYSGTAIYTKSFTANPQSGKSYFLDLGTVNNLAEVKVNGISCGTVWTPPFQVDVTKALRKGNNKLTIEVTNTWANRLIGDHNLPEDKRITKTTAPFRLEGKPLNDAGLLGPVRLKTENN